MANSFTFAPPGFLDELSPAARESWSTELADHTTQFAFNFTRYLDPNSIGAPTQLTPVSIIWSAFPARLLRLLTNEQRWAQADATRDEQDEYCEWRVTRSDDGRLTAAHFTTEVPEYWSHLAATDPDRVLELYRSLVGNDVPRSDLFDVSGTYRRDNPWNGAASAGLTHLRQGSNTLLAALRLAAESTVQRTRPDGTRVTDRHELVVCGQLGDPNRNSDPQIAEVVNDAVFSGAGVTLANPAGLYLDGLQSAGFAAPDGADVSTFWTIERGTPGHVVRARLEVPPDRGYTLGDVTLDGRSLRFGAQIADKVRVRLDALVAPATTPIESQPCR